MSVPSRLQSTVSHWANNAIVRRFASGSLWMALARCSWILGAFSVGILVARKLGPADFGTVSYAVAYVAMFSVIANLGVEHLVSRNYILYPESRDRIIGDYFLFKLLSTALMLILVAGSLGFVNDRKIVLCCLITGAGYLFYPLSVVNFVFPALVKNEYGAMAQLCCCLLYNGLRLWAVLTSQSLIVYVAAETILTGGNALIHFLFYWAKCGNPLRWRWKLKGAAALLLPAIPLSLTGIFSTIYARTDILMLEKLQDTAAVGYYTIASRFTENWYLFICLFAEIFSVAVIQAFKRSPEEYHKQLHRFIFMLFYLAVPPVIVSLIFGRPVIRLLYGESFLPAVPVFYVSVLTLLTSAILNSFCYHAINRNRLKTIAVINFSGAVLNIPLNWIFIQLWGPCGAAFSTLISMPLGFIAVLSFIPEGREDLRFILRAITRLPSFQLNQE